MIVWLLACAATDGASPYADCAMAYERIYDDPNYSESATGVVYFDAEAVQVSFTYEGSYSVLSTLSYEGRCIETDTFEFRVGDDREGLSEANLCNAAGDIVWTDSTYWSTGGSSTDVMSWSWAFVHTPGVDGFPAETDVYSDGQATAKWARTWDENGLVATWNEDSDLDGDWDTAVAYDRSVDDAGRLIEYIVTSGDLYTHQWFEYDEAGAWLSSWEESNWDSTYTEMSTWSYGEDPTLPESLRVERDDGGSFDEALSWTCPA